MLLVASYVFYGAWDWRYLSLILFSTVVDYLCSHGIEKTENAKRKKTFVTISIVSNLSLLGVFKYFDFFALNFQDLMGNFGLSVQPYFLNVALPIGISFYTFQTMSYTIEVYRGNMKPEKHLGRFALFVAFFPQLVAGPIEKATRLLPQLKKTISPDISQIKRGMIIMAWGFFLKVVVADRLGIYVDAVYADPDGHQGLPSLLAAFFFVFQLIYFKVCIYSIFVKGLDCI